ncbi:2-C-methyl-D-erythritol 2,4-cyclodiphosphate synthase [bacterium]|nr:2-C-methyl-D-erythritol 2,4-cyclodiphosphate synthase [bacterium]
MNLKTNLKYRIGNSIDHHNLIRENGVLVLGGRKFNSNYIVEAHSDGDVFYHTIANAILNALGYDDIGTYFSDKDEKNKGLDSFVILQFALEKMKLSNYKINNLSIVFESDYIILRNIKPEILRNLKKVLNCNDVSIHGTRTEQKLKLISACATILLINQ